MGKTRYVTLPAISVFRSLVDFLALAFDRLGLKSFLCVVWHEINMPTKCEVRVPGC